VIGVYAVCDRPELPLPSPLEGVEVAGLVAVVDRDARVPDAPAPADLWAHERVVEQLMEDRAVLPMRYGTALADDDAVRAAIAERRDEYAAALDRVRGRVELGLRVVGPEEDDTARPADGRAYLDALSAADARRRRLHEPLAGLAAADRRRRPRGHGELLRAAYLVETGRVPRFRGVVRKLQREHPALDLILTGPWPPWSFVVGGA
jgi:hypothetical protein